MRTWPGYFDVTWLFTAVIQRGKVLHRRKSLYSGAKNLSVLIDKQCSYAHVDFPQRLQVMSWIG
jgi:hypothetical protein